jgi:hypothetical protein
MTNLNTSLQCFQRFALANTSCTRRQWCVLIGLKVGGLQTLLVLHFCKLQCVQLCSYCKVCSPANRSMVHSMSLDSFARRLQLQLLVDSFDVKTEPMPGEFEPFTAEDVSRTHIAPLLV